MTELLTYHEERSAIRHKLGLARPRYKTRVEVKKPQTQRAFHIFEPEHYYRNMWFWELVCYQPKTEGTHPPISRILTVVSDHYAVPISTLLSTSREFGNAFPRQVAMYLARILTIRSFPEIGRYIGKRDHTTVIHAFRKLSAKAKADPEFQVTIEILCNRICGL